MEQGGEHEGVAGMTFTLEEILTWPQPPSLGEADPPVRSAMAREALIVPKMAMPIATKISRQRIFRNRVGVIVRFRFVDIK